MSTSRTAKAAAEERARQQAVTAQIEQAASWHTNLFGRRPDRGDVAVFEDHFGKGGTSKEMMALMLASDEFFERSGANFTDWFYASAKAAGQPVTPDDAAHWGEVYRQRRDRLVVIRQFLDATGIFEAPRHAAARGGYVAHDHDGHFHRHDAPPATTYESLQPSRGYASPDYSYSYGYEPARRFGIESHDHYGRLEPDHAARGGYAHTTGYRPVGRPAAVSTPELIAGWYRTYNGREIQGHELNKWLSDLDKGMALGEVYASVLGGDEWYARTGSSPTAWTAATLQALGQRPDERATSFWLGRFRRHDGNRFDTALEMVRTLGAVPGEHDRRREHNHDDDD